MEPVTLVFPECPHCGAENVAFWLVTQQKDKFFRNDIFYQLWVCGGCKRPACSYSDNQLRPGGHAREDVINFYPLPEDVSAPYGTPENMATTFRSGKSLLLLGRDADYDAACVMARKGIELAVNDMGGEGKNLFQKINNLETKRLIPPAMRDWAQHLREIDNDGHMTEKQRKRMPSRRSISRKCFSHICMLSLPKCGNTSKTLDICALARLACPHEGPKTPNGEHANPKALAFFAPIFRLEPEIWGNSLLSCRVWAKYKTREGK